MKRWTLKQTAALVSAILAAFLWLFPLFWMLLASLKPRGTQVGVLSQLFSPRYTLGNFVEVLHNTQLPRWMFNSILVTLATVLILVFTTSLAAFALSRIPFRGSKGLYYLILAGIMVPMEAIIVPSYLIMVDWGLTNSYASLILPGLAAPLGVIIQKQFFDAVPNEMMEASMIDGAGMFRIWRSIYLPLSQNAVVSFCIFAFVSSWNNFLWPFMSISDIKMMTLPVGISMFQGSYMIDYTMPMAASVLASAPIIIVFFFFQRQIVSGIALSGVKE